MASVRDLPARVLRPAAAASSRQDFQPPGTYAWTPTPETLGPQLAHLLEEPTAADELMREGMELAAEEAKLSKDVVEEERRAAFQKMERMAVLKPAEPTGEVDDFLSSSEAGKFGGPNLDTNKVED